MGGGVTKRVSVGAYNRVLLVLSLRLSAAAALGVSKMLRQRTVALPVAYSCAIALSIRAIAA